MAVTLLSTGLVCLLTAIVGGGLTALGFQFPVLQSLGRQLLLGLLGAVLIVLSLASNIEDTSDTGTQVAPPVTGTGPKAPAGPNGRDPDVVASPDVPEPVPPPAHDNPDATPTMGKQPPGQSGQASGDGGANADAGQTFFKPCLAGSLYVVVVSGYANRGTAMAEVYRLRANYPQFEFKWFQTDQFGMEAYTILAGHGLNPAEANLLTDRLRFAGLPGYVFRFMQDSQAHCRAEL